MELPLSQGPLGSICLGVFGLTSTPVLASQRISSSWGLGAVSESQKTSKSNRLAFVALSCVQRAREAKRRRVVAAVSCAQCALVAGIIAGGVHFWKVHAHFQRPSQRPLIFILL